MLTSWTDKLLLGIRGNGRSGAETPFATDVSKFLTHKFED